MKITISLITVVIFFFSTVCAVHVKHYREVDVKNGHFKAYPIKKSSHIKEIHYDRDNQYLIVRLNSVYYHFCWVSEELVSEWVSSKSLRGFYNQNVKGNFECFDMGLPDY